MEIVDTELKSPRYQSECAPVFVNTLREFMKVNVSGRLAKVRKNHGLYDAIERPMNWDIDMDLSMGAQRTFSVLRRSTLY
jgi:DNA-directed RNA polymerase III subunit RPC1